MQEQIAAAGKVGILYQSQASFKRFRPGKASLFGGHYANEARNV